MSRSFLPLVVLLSLLSASALGAVGEDEDMRWPPGGFEDPSDFEDINWRDYNLEAEEGDELWNPARWTPDRKGEDNMKGANSLNDDLARYKGARGNYKSYYKYRG